MKEIAYTTCDRMVALIAFSNINDSSYIGINTIKIWRKQLQRFASNISHIELNM